MTLFDLEPRGPGLDIYVIPGQSNGVGPGLGPFTTTLSAANDWKLRQLGRWNGRDMTLAPFAEQLDFWQLQPRSTHCFAVPLGRRYAAHSRAHRQVVALPCAYGGTSVLEWLQIVAGAAHPSNLYDDFAARLRFLLSQPGKHTVRWHEQQGEADLSIALNPNFAWHALMPDAATYLARKLDYIDKVRADFGTFPMFFGRFTDAFAAERSIKPDFYAAINSLPSLRPLCAVVDTSGLGNNAAITGNLIDSVHFNAAAHEVLGERHHAASVAMDRRIAAGHASFGIAEPG